MLKLAFPLAIALLAGCSTDAPTPTPVDVTAELAPELAPEPAATTPLYVFAHDASSVATALAAARRIEASSGVKVHVNEFGTIATAVPIFTSDFLCATGTEGRSSSYGIALARNCNHNSETVLVHELFHRLGVDHLVLPAKGITNDATDAPLETISADDLEALCSVQTCTRFVPEA